MCDRIFWLFIFANTFVVQISATRESHHSRWLNTTSTGPRPSRLHSSIPIPSSHSQLITPSPSPYATNLSSILYSNSLNSPSVTAPAPNHASTLSTPTTSFHWSSSLTGSLSSATGTSVLPHNTTQAIDPNQYLASTVLSAVTKAAIIPTEHNPSIGMSRNGSVASASLPLVTPKASISPDGLSQSTTGTLTAENTLSNSPTTQGRIALTSKVQGNLTSSVSASMFPSSSSLSFSFVTSNGLGQNTSSASAPFSSSIPTLSSSSVRSYSNVTASASSLPLLTATFTSLASNTTIQSIVVLPTLVQILASEILSAYEVDMSSTGTAASALETGFVAQILSEIPAIASQLAGNSTTTASIPAITMSLTRPSNTSNTIATIITSSASHTPKNLTASITATETPSSSLQVAWSTTTSTSSATISANSQKSTSTDLPAATIGGISAGVSVSATLVLLAIFYIWRRRKASNSRQRASYPEVAWLYDPPVTPPEHGADDGTIYPPVAAQNTSRSASREVLPPIVISDSPLMRYQPGQWYNPGHWARSGMAPVSRSPRSPRSPRRGSRAPVIERRPLTQINEIPGAESSAASTRSSYSEEPRSSEQLHVNF